MVFEQQPDYFQNAMILVCLDLDVYLEKLPDGSVVLDQAHRQIATRMSALVDQGVSERFLVGAVRDRVTGIVEGQADVAKVNRTRAPGIVQGQPLREISPDEAAAFWAVRDAWLAASAGISGDVLDLWRGRWLARQVGR